LGIETEKAASAAFSPERIHSGIPTIAGQLQAGQGLQSLPDSPDVVQVAWGHRGGIEPDRLLRDASRGVMDSQEVGEFSRTRSTSRWSSRPR